MAREATKAPDHIFSSLIYVVNGQSFMWKQSLLIFTFPHKRKHYLHIHPVKNPQSCMFQWDSPSLLTPSPSLSDLSPKDNSPVTVINKPVAFLLTYFLTGVKCHKTVLRKWFHQYSILITHKCLCWILLAINNNILSAFLTALCTHIQYFCK